jgi:WD40 repeat protein
MVDRAGPIRSIALSPDGSILAAGSRDGVVRLWDVATGVLRQRLEKHKGAQSGHELYAVGFSADGKHLAVGDSSFTGVLIRDLEQKDLPERQLLGHVDTVNSLSRGGDKWLVSAGPDGSVLEWEQSALGRPPSEGLKKQDEFKYRMPLTSMDISADGGLIVTGGHGGQVQLWDGVEHVLIGDSFPGHARDIQSVAMAPDGNFFVTADITNILVWPGPDRWASMICSKLVWNMSARQWRDWVSPNIPYKEQCAGLRLAPE